MSSTEGAKTWRAQDDMPSFGVTILTINVGEHSPTQTFSLHKDIAVKFSDFLAAAVRDGWQEATENVVNLPKETTESFKIFEAFVYTGRIYSHKNDDEYIDSDGGLSDHEYLRLTNAWLLGERLQATAFKDAVVDALIEKVTSEEASPLLAFEDIYAESSGCSPMKELLVDMSIWSWSQKAFAWAGKSSADKEFFLHVATKQSRLHNKGWPASAPYKQGPTCIYHEHGDDKPCYKTMFK